MNMNKSNSNESTLNEHNPLIKALSNSNLDIYDQRFKNNDTIRNVRTMHSKMHSAANLLDVSNDENTHFDLLSLSNGMPPKRPPPPIPPNPIQYQPQKVESLIDIETPCTHGFDDDFSAFTTNKNDFNQPQLVNVNRPPPLPPLPSSLLNNSVVKNETPFFTLNSSESEPTTPSQTPSVSVLSQQPPPLPPMPIKSQTLNANSACLPPPLPPMPSVPPRFVDPALQKNIQRPQTLPTQQFDLLGNPITNTVRFNPFE